MRRIPELDDLRGIAVVMVLALHLGLAETAPGLASAVDLFFVLSGYLITRILLEHEPGPGFLRAFYARRVLRIWPIYYAVILGFLAVNRLIPLRQRTTGVFYYLTFTQFSPYYWFARPPRFSIYFKHTWTLAAEEQFYLLWPLVAVYLGRRALAAMIPLLVVSAFLARLWFWPLLLATNWDGFALGALLAWLFARSGSPSPRRLKTVCGLLAVLAATLTYPWWKGSLEFRAAATWPGRARELALSMAASRMFLLYFAVVGLVIAFQGHPFLKPLRNRHLVYVGTISYGLYFYHLPLYAMISPWHYDVNCTDSMGLDALKLLASFAVAAISWQYFEKPILRMKDRVPYPNEGSDGVATTRTRDRRVPAPHFEARQVGVKSP